MKLQDLAAPKKSTNVAKVFESYFGSRLPLNSLTVNQTKGMLNKVRGLINEHRKTTGRHSSERNPSYLKLIMMEQALAHRIAEAMPGTPGAPAMPGAPAAPAAPAASSAQQAGLAAQNIAQQKDPKVKAALTKASKGQTLTPDEQKLVAGVALMHTESKLARAYRMLKESEVQQAQVVLAAQDMVDKMQGMLEDVSELQFKELPALVDSIKNQVGIDQAQQFNTDATAALTGLLQNIQGAKQQLDAALGVVTGQAPAGGFGADLDAAGADMSAAQGDMAAAGDLAAGGVDDLTAGDDLEAGAEMPPAEPAAKLGGAGALGRGRR